MQRNDYCHECKEITLQQNTGSGYYCLKCKTLIQRTITLGDAYKEKFNEIFQKLNKNK
jgi:hypothetical protein